MARARRPSGQTIAILRTLAQDPATWVHGYEICQSTGLKAGTVYPILIRLADRGHLDSEWEADAPPGRPPRHLYRLSTDGVEYATACLRPAQHPEPALPDTTSHPKRPRPLGAEG